MLALICALPLPAMAADITFTGTSPIHFWNAGGSWAGGVAPGINDRAIIQSGPVSISINSPSTAIRDIGSVWVKDGAPVTSLATTSGQIMRFHGVDGVAFQTDSANIVNFFQRSILANDLVFRATNVAGGGIRWLGILSAGTQQGLNLQSHTAVFDAVNARNTIEFANNAFAIRGTGNIIKTGAGTLTFTNMVSEYTGSTTILGGKLALAGAGSIASSSGLRNDGIFDISATTAGTSVRTLSGSGVVDLGAKALTLDNAADSFAGTIQGTGRLVLAGGIATLTGANTFSGGTTVNAGTLQIGDGGRSGSIVGDIANNGTLAFNRADTLAFDGVVSGSGAIRQLGAGTTNLTGDSSGFAGTTTVEAGTLSVNGVLGGTLLVTGGRLQGVGTVGSTTSQAGGIIAPGNSIGTLTINGNYAGNGGLLEIETALGGDASPSDRLVVTGDTAGSTRVGVVNLGGAGAPTVEGIKVVDVGGASNGVFTLQGGDYLFQGRQAIVAGAYAYTLQKNGVATPNDGDWYLRSAYDASAAPAGTPTTPAAAPVIVPIYQPGVPLYEAYGQVLQSLNNLQTLRQRVGDRFEGQPDPNSTRSRAIWARIDGAHSHVTPRFSTSGTSYEIDGWRMQAGVDGQLHSGQAGTLVGGLTIHHGQALADVSSVFGRGSIDASGTGFGGALTWYGQNGLYADAQAQLSWFDSDLGSSTAGRQLAKGKAGFGYAAGLEIGQRLAIGDDGWSLTPQAQLVYSRVDADSFIDPFGARVALDDGDSLRGRIGLSADYRQSWRDQAGQPVSAALYGIANLSYEFLDGTTASVADTSFASQQERLWGDIGLGAKYDWAGYSLYGEVNLRTSLTQFADSHGIGGRAGLRVSW